MYSETPAVFTNLPPDDSVETNERGEIDKVVFTAYPPDNDILVIWNNIKRSFENTKYSSLINSIRIEKTDLDGFYSYGASDTTVIFYDPKFYGQFNGIKGIDINYLILFSLAHEIGHFVDGDVNTNIKSMESEKKADLFACRILCTLNEASAEKIKNVVITLSGANHNDFYPNKGDRIKEIDSFFLNDLCEDEIAGGDIRIGNQIWNNLNLNVDTYSNGDTIREAKNVTDWLYCLKNEIGCCCDYDFDPQNDYKYGKLYNIYAVNDKRGLAPIGWHIPSKDEWVVVMDLVNGLTEFAIDKAKNKKADIRNWLIASKKNTQEIRASLFSPHSGGVCYSIEGKVNFSGLDSYNVCWATGKYGTSIHTSEAVIKPGYSTKWGDNIIDNRDIGFDLRLEMADFDNFGFSVRVIKNTTN
ncbi:MAG TPA: FISUMP domain-containing protein [Flavipsychrobacter sp.]|nr:FISUMP domain-containing protein [Flavipsychrobacter sp.]